MRPDDLRVLNQWGTLPDRGRGGPTEVTRTDPAKHYELASHVGLVGIAGVQGDLCQGKQRAKPPELSTSGDIGAPSTGLVPPAAAAR
jgi:hypothetical protein